MKASTILFGVLCGLNFAVSNVEFLSWQWAVQLACLMLAIHIGSSSTRAEAWAAARQSVLDWAKKNGVKCVEGGKEVEQ